MVASQSLKKVIEFFGMSLSDMKREWAALSAEDKTAIREGIENGSLTY